MNKNRFENYYNEYQNNLGEVEARDTSERKNMTGEERYEVLPKVDGNVVHAVLDNGEEIVYSLNLNFANDITAIEKGNLVNQHSISVSTLKNLPDLLNDPIIAYDKKAQSIY